jgi:hypothetical protein
MIILSKVTLANANSAQTVVYFFLLMLHKAKYPKVNYFRGGSRGGRTRRAPPPKIGKNMIFWRKIVIFHTKYPTNFRASLRNWKKYDFLA